MKTAHLHRIDTSASADLDNLSLPAWIYHDPDFFEAEKRSIFRQAWQVVCHLNDIPKAGDYHTFEFFGESVLVVRAEDGGVRAFTTCAATAPRASSMVPRATAASASPAPTTPGLTGSTGAW